MTILLKDAKQGDIVSRRGEVFKVLYVAASCDVELDRSRLDESDHWVRDQYRSKWPLDQRVLLLHREV